MDVKSGLKETTRVTAPVASNTLSSAEPGDGRRRSQEAWRARLSLDHPGHQALPGGLPSCAENRDFRPGAVRSDDGAIPGLGSQSVVVDVRIPAVISHINCRSGDPETWAAGQTLSRLFPLRFGPAAGHRSLKRLLYIKNETVLDELVVGVEPGNRTDVVN